METRREIKIFLASSDEMKSDRFEFGDLVRKLNDIYVKRGIGIKLVKWEDLPQYYQGCRTQDMYNEIISECNMFTAMFYKQAGKFTIEEFDVARECFDRKSFPKVYTFMKDLVEGEEETPELISFKDKLYKELGHYWCRYGNNDTMQLHFVMQLQLLEANSLFNLEVKDSVVLLDNHKIASLDNVPFAANNELLIELKNELIDINDEIEEIESDFLNSPDKKTELKIIKKRAKRAVIQKKIDDQRRAIFDTALHVNSLYGNVSSERLKRAVVKFDAGDLNGAISTLDPEEIEADGRRGVKGCKVGAKLIAESRNIVRESIDAYRFRAKALLSKIDNPNVVNEANKLYKSALLLSRDAELPECEIAELLFDYGCFAKKYNLYEKAISLFSECIEIKEKLNNNSLTLLSEIIISLNNIGTLYEETKQYNLSYRVHSKAQKLCIILKKSNDENYIPLIAKTYYHLGVCMINGIYNDMLANSFLLESMNFYIGLLENDNSRYDYFSYLSDVIEKRGFIYMRNNFLDKAEEELKQSILIREELSEINPEDYKPLLANVYNDIGVVYCKMKQYELAYDNFINSLEVIEKLSLFNPNVYMPKIAEVQRNLGDLCREQHKTSLAIAYYEKSLSIYRQLIETSSDSYSYDVARTYDSLALLYEENLDEYNKAEILYRKSAEIYKKMIDRPSDNATYYYLKSMGKVEILYKKLGRDEDANQLHELINDETIQMMIDEMHKDYEKYGTVEHLLIGGYE
ncbi:MAG: tetratricopeptide repeat protein [Bacteroidales bacterium]